MTNNTRLALASSVLLLPALILVCSGLLHLEAPAALIHPVLVVGGLLLALAFNAPSVFRLNLRKEGVELVCTLSIRMRESSMNLIALGASVLLISLVFGYVIVENLHSH